MDSASYAQYRGERVLQLVNGIDSGLDMNLRLCASQVVMGVMGVTKRHWHVVAASTSSAEFIWNPAPAQRWITYYFGTLLVVADPSERLSTDQRGKGVVDDLGHNSSSSKP